MRVFDSNNGFACRVWMNFECEGARWESKKLFSDKITVILRELEADSCILSVIPGNIATFFVFWFSVKNAKRITRSCGCCLGYRLLVWTPAFQHKQRGWILWHIMQVIWCLVTSNPIFNSSMQFVMHYATLLCKWLVGAFWKNKVSVWRALITAYDDRAYFV